MSERRSPQASSDVKAEASADGRESADPAAADGASIDAAAEMYRRFRKAAEQRGEARMRGPARPRQQPGRSSASGERTGLAGDPRSTSRSAVPPQRAGSLRDPKPLGEAVKGLIRSRGWSAPVAVGGVISRWEQLVGEAIAEHCTPESFEDGVVVVACDSTAWATNLKLMKSQLLEMFARELGPGIVTALDIRGPSAPSWKKGRLTVRGRGPRDTYG
ncbi:DUF721 domain-containing protein [Nesterenkonia populi]|uniref:DUF721 domain-containing protein n=1 Tax=Nesterenkonia populi TaxID=1591087 RepID=UPI001FEC8640|nr:DciA family protein [Nesterenkonia populi]